MWTKFLNWLRGEKKSLATDLADEVAHVETVTGETLEVVATRIESAAAIDFHPDGSVKRVQLKDGTYRNV